MKETIISFAPSPDAVRYKLYYDEAPRLPTYKSRSVEIVRGTVIRLSTELALTKKVTILNVAVAAVDKVGNESDLVYARNVTVERCCSRCPRRYDRYQILARLTCELMHVFGGCEYAIKRNRVIRLW